MAELEEQIDELYGLPAPAFTGARDDLAGRLKKAGDRDASARVKALRRPTVPAWAVNQLVRADPGAFEELIGAGDELRKAQRRALSGAGAGAGAFREAATRRRGVLTRLTDRAMEILEGEGIPPATHRDAISATLEAASSGEEAAQMVRAGRLVKELVPPTEFDAVSPLTVMRPPASAAAASKAAGTKQKARGPAKPTREDRAAAAEAALSVAQDRARSTAREAQSAGRKADRSGAEADRADAEATRLEGRAKQARERHRFLAGRAKADRDAADRAEAEADQAARDAKRLGAKAKRG